MPVQKTCEECRQPFQCKPAEAPRRRFCSKRCQMVARYREQRAAGTWKRPQKPRRGTETPCPVCGKMVYADRGGRARGMGIYCSRQCQTAGQTKDPILKQCAYCGKELEVRPSRGELRYCSRDCMANGKTKRPLDRSHNGKPARLDATGYVMLWEPTHPDKSHKGWVREHRLVAEATLGRYLQPGEEVHHINGEKDDNRPATLVVLGKSEHAAATAANNWGKMNGLEAQLEEYRKRFGAL
jgi:endogenous inhibitor of DNA gyrase (YacG/DUF329 family)